MKKFKICIVGCGFMTREGHGPSCVKYAAEHEDVELAACCDINLAAAHVTPDTLTRDISVALLNRKIQHIRKRKKNYKKCGIL